MSIQIEETPSNGTPRFYIDDEPANAASPLGVVVIGKESSGKSTLLAFLSRARPVGDNIPGRSIPCRRIIDGRFRNLGVRGILRRSDRATPGCF